MIYFVLLCGGKGTRTGLDDPKQYVLVKNKPVFMYSYDVFVLLLEFRKLTTCMSLQFLHHQGA